MVNQLQKIFISHCDIQQLEVNSNQIEIVKKLEQYYKENFQSYFSKLFSKKYGPITTIADYPKNSVTYKYFKNDV